MLKRWLRIFRTYDFYVIHRTRTQHANADALSRAPHALNLSQAEVTELLEDDQILALGASLSDDQQAISSDYLDQTYEEMMDSGAPEMQLNLSGDIPVGLAQNQQTDPLLKKVRE